MALQIRKKEDRLKTLQQSNKIMRLLKNYDSIELNTLKYTKRNLKCTRLNIGYSVLYFVYNNNSYYVNQLKFILIELNLNGQHFVERKVKLYLFHKLN